MLYKAMKNYIHQVAGKKYKRKRRITPITKETLEMQRTELSVGSKCDSSTRKKKSNLSFPGPKASDMDAHIYSNIPHRIFENSDLIFNFSPTR